MPQKHYRNAPITEAVIELRVSREHPVAVEELAGIHDLIGDEYPDSQTTVAFEGQISLGVAVETATRQAAIGYRFRSADGLQIIQAHTGLFAFSRLKPYERWETFRDEARRLWGIYVAHVGECQLERVAVRYINRIEFPGPVRLEDYLGTYPKLSPGLPDTLSGYFMQLIVPQDNPTCSLRMNQAIVPPSESSTVAVTLDNDVYCDSDLPAIEEVWDLLEQLRHKKNEIFEACITDKTRELID